MAGAVVNIHDFRLTDSDTERVVAAIRHHVIAWEAAGSNARWGDVLTLQRLGAHAIGCSLHDLRDIEVKWIEAQAIIVAGLKR